MHNEIPQGSQQMHNRIPAKSYQERDPLQKSLIHLHEVINVSPEKTGSSILPMHPKLIFFEFINILFTVEVLFQHLDA